MLYVSYWWQGYVPTTGHGFLSHTSCLITTTLQLQVLIRWSLAYKKKAVFYQKKSGKIDKKSG